MAGGIYISIAVSFALAGGIIGKIKGSSFFLWFLISGLVPVIGLAAAILYRYEKDELRRSCPRCGRVCMAYDALCVRCGHELDFPAESEMLPPLSQPAAEPEARSVQWVATCGQSRKEVGTNARS